MIPMDVLSLRKNVVCGNQYVLVIMMGDRNEGN